MRKQKLSWFSYTTAGLLCIVWFLQSTAVAQSLPNRSENRIALGLEAEERGFAAPYEIVVIGVRPDTPAEKAGIKPGDLIKSAAGQPIGSIDQLAARVQALTPGDSLELGIQRGNEPLQAVAKFPASNQPPRTAELIPQGRPLPTNPQFEPQQPAAPQLQPLPPQPESLPIVERPEPGSGRMGVTVENVATTPPGPGVPVKRGAVVVAVAPDSPAALVGVKPGNVIVAIDGVVIRDAAALIEQVSKTRPGQRVELGVYQGESLAKLAVVLTAPEEVAASGSELSAGGRDMPADAKQLEPQTTNSGAGLLGALGGFFGGNRAKPPATLQPMTQPAALPNDPPMLNQPPAEQLPTAPRSETSSASGANASEVKELKTEIEQLRLQLESLQKRLNDLEGN